MTNISNLLFGRPGGVGPHTDVTFDATDPGSPDDRLLGTGESFPAFPAMIEYNGVLLNSTTSFDYYHINGIDGIDDAEVRDNRSPNPNDDGEETYGSYYSGRSIVINGEIRAYHLWKTDDMREALLRAFARKNKEFALRFRLGSASKDRIIFCKKAAKVEIPNQQPTKQVPWVPFMIPLRSKDPRLLSFQEHNITSSIGEFTIINDGNYDAKAVYRFYGPATSYILTRTYETEQHSIYIGSIDPGDYIEIDGKKVRDSMGNNAYDRFSDNSDKILLGPAPAPNDFELTGVGTSSDSFVSVQWRHSWV